MTRDNASSIGAKQISFDLAGPHAGSMTRDNASSIGATSRAETLFEGIESDFPTPEKQRQAPVVKADVIAEALRQMSSGSGKMRSGMRAQAQLQQVEETEAAEAAENVKMTNTITVTPQTGDYDDVGGTGYGSPDHIGSGQRQPSVNTVNTVRSDNKASFLSFNSIRAEMREKAKDKKARARERKVMQDILENMDENYNMDDMGNNVAMANTFFAF